MDDIIIKDGWYWPKKDIKCWNWLIAEKELPYLISDYCKEKRVVIQAGGNCGFYVKSYAGIFETTYTFEPDNLNFQCLVMNLYNLPVVKQQAFLGDKRATMALTESHKNVGAYSVDVDKSGIVPTLMIDDLGLTTCDLIHLDVEGWEFPALKGAVETIKKCSPVIALEWMNHGKKYGYPNEEISKWLFDLGYNETHTVMHERIFVRK